MARMALSLWSNEIKELVHQSIEEKEMPGYWGRGKLVTNSWKLVFRSSNHQPQKSKKKIEVIQHGTMIAEAAGIFFGSEEVKENTISVQQQRNQNQPNLDQFEKEPDMESNLSLESLLNDINCDYNRQKQGLHVDNIFLPFLQEEQKYPSFFS